MPFEEESAIKFVNQLGWIESYYNNEKAAWYFKNYVNNQHQSENLASFGPYPVKPVCAAQNGLDNDIVVNCLENNKLATFYFYGEQEIKFPYSDTDYVFEG